MPAHCFKSSNGHTVKIHGRLLYRVTSASRSGLEHTVDLEGYEHWKTICDCEAWKYGMRPCRHIAACVEIIAQGCDIPEENFQEWQDRLLYLLAMRHSFAEAMLSNALKVLRRPKPITLKPKPETNKRSYKLRFKTYETPTTAKKNPKR